MQRLNIAIDIASALEYLHCGTGYVGDFGLSKVISSTFPTHDSSSMAIKGTIGYIATEYGMGDTVTIKGDVYSYGILVLEVLTNIRPTHNAFEDHANLHNYVSSAIPGRVMEIVDPTMQLENITNKIKDSMAGMLGIVVACSKEFPRDCMSITDVVTELHIIRSASLAEGLR